MRTLRAGVAVTLGEGEGSCARKNRASSTPIASANKVTFVMSSKAACRPVGLCEGWGDISNDFLLPDIERLLDFAPNDKLEKTTPVHIWEQVILCFALC